MVCAPASTYLSVTGRHLPDFSACDEAGDVFDAGVEVGGATADVGPLVGVGACYGGISMVSMIWEEKVFSRRCPGR